jgi:hypothetical protein
MTLSAPMKTLPKEMEQRLLRCHQRGCATVSAHGFEPESFEALEELELHRWFWRPDQPRVVLIAESHVLTTASDLALTMRNDAVHQSAGTAESWPRPTFVRLVYCLGYGETRLLESTPLGFSNRGTPDFWLLFARILEDVPAPTRMEYPSLDARLRAKWRILERLRECGIWLLDASVHAIYRGNGIALPLKAKQ